MDPKNDNALSEQVKNWIIQSVDPEASFIEARRLYGGISSIVHHVVLQVNQSTKCYVLRQFDNMDWLKDEPDLALHEAESLRWAAQADVPTPELIAFDAAGEACGLPVVLMTLLEGTVVLQPDNMELWLNGLAESLATIHKVDADQLGWNYFTYNDVHTLEVPAWSSMPELWSQAINIVKGPRPGHKLSFIHRDYHPTNVLWNHNEVSGVVDWVNSCYGPAGIDIGHCRLNLAQLYGGEAADSFLKAYESFAGSAFEYDPYWDLLSLIDILFGTPSVYAGWPAFGVDGLTDELIIERLDAYMASVVKRAAESNAGK